jgi:hypothetical protein
LKVSASQSNHRFATPNKSFDYVIENKSEDSSEVVKLTFDNYAVVPIISWGWGWGCDICHKARKNVCCV